MMRHAIKAPMSGSLWMQNVSVGQQVEAGSTVAIMECMKTEVPLATERSGVVVALLDAGTTVNEGDVIAVVESS